MCGELYQKRISLGMIKAPDSFQNDIDILALYQKFSEELLRISLIGVTAFASLILIVLREPKISDHLHLPSRLFILLAGVAFGVSAALALLHRYVSSDSLACQLAALRAETRGQHGDDKIRKSNLRGRKKMFKYSRWALFASSCSIALGALALAIGMSFALAS